MAEIDSKQPEIIVDDEITLRRFSHDYDQARYDNIVASREHLLPWLPWAHFYKDFKEMPEFINGQIQKYDSNEILGYDIIYKGQAVGGIDLHNISSENNRAEIGYWLGKDFTGKGIASRATQAIIDYAFDTLKIHRILIRAATKNTASCAVAERLGFTKEGMLKDEQLLDDIYYDTSVYAKINEKQQ